MVDCEPNTGYRLVPMESKNGKYNLIVGTNSQCLRPNICLELRRELITKLLFIRAKLAFTYHNFTESWNLELTQAATLSRRLSMNDLKTEKTMFPFPVALNGI